MSTALKFSIHFLVGPGLPVQSEGSMEAGPCPVSGWGAGEDNQGPPNWLFLAVHGSSDRLQLITE